MDMPHILIVDDDPVTLDLLYTLVRSRLPTVAVEGVCSSIVAWGLLNAKAYDVLVTDLTLPELTGAALAANLYQFNPSIPVILISGGGLSGTPPLNMFAYLSKPIDSKSFIHIVKGAIQHRHSLHLGMCNCGETLMTEITATDGA